MGTYSVVWERLTYCSDWDDGTTTHPEVCWHVDGYVVLNTPPATGHFYILKPDSAGQYHSFTWASDTGFEDSSCWFYAGSGTLDIQIDNPSIGLRYPVSDGESTILTQPNIMPGLPVGDTTYTHDPNGYVVLNTSTRISSFNSEVSLWSLPEIEEAYQENLIPDSLIGEDLTKDINRAEFAAVCVKVYENLAATKAIPAVTNPFTDCQDIEVLKAYNIGVVIGTGPNTFSPYDLLNREQAATMLTRIFKRVSMPGWTLVTDSQFPLNYTMPALVQDDGDISEYARESVYFMAANNIINGIGNNLFAPRNITDRQTAVGYANATREQALVIALRMVKNLA